MFIVMIPNYWGKGETALEAANAARKQAGKKAGKGMPKPRLVFSYDASATSEAYINEYGMLCWVGERPSQVEKAM